MKRIPVIAAGVLAALFVAAGPAQAQPYVGVSAGQSRFNLDCDGTTHCDDTGVGYKGFVGYEVNDNVAIEAAWYRQGKARTTGTDALLGDVTADLRGDAIGVYGLLLAPYSQHFKLFGKLGLVSSRITLDTNSTAGGASSRRERHENIGWGIGGQYEFGDSLGVRLEYERTRVEFAQRKRDVDLLTAGIVFRF